MSECAISLPDENLKVFYPHLEGQVCTEAIANAKKWLKLKPYNPARILEAVYNNEPFCEKLAGTIKASALAEARQAQDPARFAIQCSDLKKKGMNDIDQWMTLKAYDPERVLAAIAAREPFTEAKKQEIIRDSAKRNLQQYGSSEPLDPKLEAISKRMKDAVLSRLKADHLGADKYANPSIAVHFKN